MEKIFLDILNMSLTASIIIVAVAGMVIYMLFMDTKQHSKPHVHVYYGEYEAAVGIDGELLAGSLPHKQLKNGSWMVSFS